MGSPGPGFIYSAYVGKGRDPAPFLAKNLLRLFPPLGSKLRNRETIRSRRLLIILRKQTREYDGRRPEVLFFNKL